MDEDDDEVREGDVFLMTCLYTDPGDHLVKKVESHWKVKRAGKPWLYTDAEQYHVFINVDFNRYGSRVSITPTGITGPMTIFCKDFPIWNEPYGWQIHMSSWSSAGFGFHPEHITMIIFRKVYSTQ